jgi:hypothetical protein
MVFVEIFTDDMFDDEERRKFLNEDLIDISIKEHMSLSARRAFDYARIRGKFVGAIKVVTLRAIFTGDLYLHVIHDSGSDKFLGELNRFPNRFI